MEHARDRYIAPFSSTCTDAADCALRGINYDATFWPVPIGNWCPGLTCATWNESVGSGVESLNTALTTLPKSSEPFVVFGYSQGGAVVSDEMRAIANNPAILDKIDSVVLIGNAYNPDGGFFTRLGFLGTIPIWDVTFGPPTPVNTGVPMTGIGFEYDPVMYAPLYLGNPLSLLNAIAALETVHGYYLTPNGNGPTDPIAYNYTEQQLADVLATGCPGAYCRVDSFGNKYYMIPAKSLPIFDLIMNNVPGPLKGFLQPVVNFLTPVTKVLIDLGYDWSGDPGVPRVASFLPFNPAQNWVKVGLDLVTALGEGAKLAFSGTTTPLDPGSSTAPPPVPLEKPAQDGGAGTPADSTSAATGSTAATTASTLSKLSTLSVAADNAEQQVATKDTESATAARTTFTPSVRAEATTTKPAAQPGKAGGDSSSTTLRTNGLQATAGGVQSAGGKGAKPGSAGDNTANNTAKDANSAPAAA
jgi:hypothetical protein